MFKRRELFRLRKHKICTNNIWKLIQITLGLGMGIGGSMGIFFVCSILKYKWNFYFLLLNRNKKLFVELAPTSCEDKMRMGIEQSRDGRIVEVVGFEKIWPTPIRGGRSPTVLLKQNPTIQDWSDAAGLRQDYDGVSRRLFYTWWREINLTTEHLNTGKTKSWIEDDSSLAFLPLWEKQKCRRKGKGRSNGGEERRMKFDRQENNQEEK